MKYLSSFLLFLCFAVLIVSCQPKEKPRIEFPRTDLSQTSMIPLPVEVVPSYDAFGLDQNTTIRLDANSEDFRAVGEFLANGIKDKTGLEISLDEATVPGGERAIYLLQSDSIGALDKEAYKILVNRDSVLIHTGKAEGAFRAIQTLRQMIPETSNDTLAEWPIWPIPTGEIKDYPFFEFRGSMLDVSRHFFSVEEVKKYIDLLSYYKINVLHLHLSDDQGWRIEIKSWPKLTEIGGSTEVGGEAGGFYSQEDYKEIVAYAAERYMTIIPEIDMPGHTNAASVSYPFLDGTGKPLKLYEGTRVGFSTFDTRKDTVYTFIDDVVREISALTPGPYFHMGGDESHVTKTGDYRYFVNRVEKIIQKHGKKMIGWDEVATAETDSTSIAQFWSNESNASQAVNKGMKIILSPAKKAYLDMKYDSLSLHGLNWAAYIPVDTAYNWNPEKYVAGIDKSSILGLEAPLWSETISNSAEMEYLAFPRVIGYAELSWSQPEKRDWENYKVRLALQTPYLQKMNVNFYRSELIDWPDDKEQEQPQE